MSNAKVSSGLIHRPGGGKDLGFQRGDFDRCAMAPFFWHAFVPCWWTAADLGKFSFLWDGKLRKCLHKLAKLGA